MKYRFVDAHNCDCLLPPRREISIARILDQYLGREVNDVAGEMNGCVDRLIQHNQRTAGKQRGPLRLCNSPIEIVMVFDIAKKDAKVSGYQRPTKDKARFHTVFKFENGVTWKTVIPLQFLLKGWGDANRGHQCYVHTIAHNISEVRSYEDMVAREEDGHQDFPYVGITGRNWLLRLGEHMREMNRGSRKRFHAAWRESLGVEDVHFISELKAINLNFDEAMNWEEYAVDRVSETRLNMIPGGFKGIRFLHEHRVIDRTDIGLEERDKAIAEYIRQNPRKGVPNPFIAELWKDDAFYLNYIESRPKTLTPDQVRAIRELASQGMPVAEIAEEVDALNEIQVRNVISGRYYGRVK
jgi:hypothetical protein